MKKNLFFLVLMLFAFSMSMFAQEKSSFFEKYLQDKTTIESEINVSKTTSSKATDNSKPGTLLPKTYQSSYLTQDTRDVYVGYTDQKVVGIDIIVDGDTSDLLLTKMVFKPTGTTSLSDIIAIKLVYPGSKDGMFGYGDTLTTTDGNGQFVFLDTIKLKSDTNKFWLVYDIASSATLGNKLDAVCDSIIVQGAQKIPNVTNPAGELTIVGIPELTLSPDTIFATLNSCGEGDVTGSFTITNSGEGTLAFDISKFDEEYAGTLLNTYENAIVRNTGMTKVDNYIYGVTYSEGEEKGKEDDEGLSYLVKYNLTTQTVENMWVIHFTPYSVAYDGESLWIGDCQGTIRKYDLNGNYQNESFSLPYWCPTLTWDGDYFITSSMNDEGDVYKVDKLGNFVATYKKDEEVIFSQFSMDGNQLWGYDINNEEFCEISLADGKVKILNGFNPHLPHEIYSIVHTENSIYYGLWEGGLYQISDGYNGPLTLSLYSDELLQDASDKIDVKFTVSPDMWTGQYYKDILVLSNTPDKAIDTITLALTVNGTPDIASSITTISFGTAYTNFSKTKTFTVYNNGCDTLKITDINTPEYFSVDDTSFNILPFDSTVVTVTFSPLNNGDYSGNLSIVNNDKELNIALTATAIGSPEMTVSIDTANTYIIECNGTDSKTFTIENSGNTPLTFSIDTVFRDDFENGLDDWEYNGDWAITNDGYNGTKGLSENASGNYSDNMKQYIKYRTNIVVTEATILSFDIKYETQSCCDYLSVQVSEDNSNNWSTIKEFRDISDWTHKQYNLSDYVKIGKEVCIRFYFYSNCCTNKEGVSIDNFNIKLIPNWLSLSNITGTIASGENAQTNINFNAINTKSGIYTYPIFINSNDSANTIDTIVCIMDLQGSPQIELSDNTLDLDTAFVDYSITKSFTIFNRGCDTLNIIDIANSKTEFSVDNDSLLINPFDSAIITVKFAPLGSGTYKDTLTIINSDTDIKLPLIAVALSGPEISVNTDTIAVEITKCGGTATKTFIIENTGDIPLTYNIDTALFDNFENGLSNWEYNGEWSVTSNGIDGTNGLSENASRYYHENMDQYIKYKKTIVVNSFSKLSFDINYALNSNDYLEIQISSDNNNWHTIGKIVGYNYSWIKKEYNLATYTSIGAQIQIRFYFYSNSCCNGNGVNIDNFKITQIPDWVFLSNITGTIASGENKSIGVTFDGSGLNSKQYTTMAYITSNDSANTTTSMVYIMDLQGAPAIELPISTLDFGDVPTNGGTKLLTFDIDNTGCDTLKITSITSDDVNFTVISSPIEVLPFSTESASVEFTPSEVKEYNATITIGNNDVEKTVTLTGTGVNPPALSVNADTVRFTLSDFCSSQQVNNLFSITNNGTGGDLEISMNHTSWLSLEYTDTTIKTGTTIQMNATVIDDWGDKGAERTAIVYINSNDPEKPKDTVVCIFNINRYKDLSLSNETINFGDIYLGNSITKEFTIENLSCDVSINIIDISSSLPQFAIYDTTFDLGNDGNRSISIVFTPEEVKNYEAVLTIETDFKDTTIVLKGSGVSTTTPTINTSVVSLDYDMVNDGIVAVKDYKVEGYHLTDDITITAPEGFQISEDDAQYASSLILQRAGDALIPTTLFVKFSPDEEKVYSGDITHKSTGAEDINVGVTAENIVPIVVSTNNIDFGYVPIGDTALLSFTVSGKNLTDGLRFEFWTDIFNLSLDPNDDFDNDLYIDEEDGIVNDTTVYVRFIPTKNTVYSTNLMLESDNCNRLNITINGRSSCPEIQLSNIKDSTVNEGSQVSFTANVTFGEVEPMTFVWKHGDKVLSDGGDISGATTSTLTIANVSVSDAGNYICTVSNACGANIADTALLTIIPLPDGIEKQSINIDDISIYPNPSNGVFNITKNTNNDIELRILSIEGREVYHLNKLSDNNTINLSGYNSGVYIVKFIYSDKVAVSRIIIE